MPVVQRHEEVEDWIYSEARKYLTRKPRVGFHVSDLMTPRKAYWASRLGAEPLQKREILYFAAGRAHEEIVTALSQIGRYRRVEGEWLGTTEEPYRPGDGVKYQVDAVVPTGERETPVEIKTNRRPTVVPAEKVAEEYSTYLWQLRAYMAILGQTPGYLVVFHLMARNLSVAGDDEAYSWLKQSEPLLVVYQIDFTEEELAEARADLQERKSLLEVSQAMGDHTILSECPEWMCGRVHTDAKDPVCPNCGRVYVVGEEKPDGSKRGVVRLCEDCKVGGKRVELVREVQEIFVPTCRFWESCLPGQWSQYHMNYFKATKEAD